MGEHLPCKQGVRGSNPLVSSKKTQKFDYVFSTEIIINNKFKTFKVIITVNCTLKTEY